MLLRQIVYPQSWSTVKFGFASQTVTYGEAGGEDEMVEEDENR